MTVFTRSLTESPGKDKSPPNLTLLGVLPSVEVDPRALSRPSLTLDTSRIATNIGNSMPFNPGFDRAPDQVA
jgi:hypothetical protein